MPAKPVWYHNLPRIIQELEALPHPYVDRATLEFLLGVKRRRAQQILAPCISERVGSSGLADRESLLARLRRLAAGEDATYEVRRRQKLGSVVDRLRRERLQQPQLLVEAPASVVHQKWTDLPAGVALSPGKIAIEFQTPSEALEKLLALAMAIGNDFESFERLTRSAQEASL